MDNNEVFDYLDITDLHFAAWNMIKPINFIWIDFTDKCLRTGVKDEPTDTVKDDAEFQAAQRDTFRELISYDEEGRPILDFDDDDDTRRDDSRYTVYPAKEEDLMGFLGDMEDIDLFSWRPQYPSLKEGLCWRVDVYIKDGREKHFSGQARFPKNWSEFARSLNRLVDRVETPQGAASDDKPEE